MKKLLLTISGFCFFMLAGAQYTVTKIKGRVKLIAGSYLKPGSIVDQSDTLIFSSANDRLWVITQSGGEKVFGPSAFAKVTANGLMQSMVDADIHNPSPLTLRAGISIIEKLPASLLSDADASNKILIESENLFLFDPASYPQNGEGEFFLQVTTESRNKNQPRRLRVRDDTLIIYYQDFLTETFNSDNRYTLGYHKTGSNISVKVADIKPSFDLTNEMESIIWSTVSACKKTNILQDSLLMKTYKNVYQMSGKPNGILFTRLFNKYWAGDTTAGHEFQPKGKGLVGDDTTGSSAIPVLSNLVGTTRGNLPDNFSLRQYAPPVGNQGEYSTCVAWSTAYAARTIAYAVNHNYTYLHDSDEIKANTFSPDYVYNSLSNDNTCNEGLTIYKALSFISNSGVVTNRTGTFVCANTYMQADVDKAKQFRIKDFQTVVERKGTEDELVTKTKSLLAARHPVVFGMITPSTFEAVDNSGEWRPSPAEYQLIDSFNSKQLHYFPPSHAMCAIGYNDSIAGGSFEVMNSWGESCGNNGFYWINYHDFYLFAQRFYTINDFLPGEPVLIKDLADPKTNNVQIPSPVVLPAKPDSIVAVKIPAIPPTPANSTQTTNNLQVGDTANSEARLKGSLQFMYQSNDGSAIPLKLIERNDTLPKTDGAKEQVANRAYSFYNFNRQLHLQDQYNIKVSLTGDAYVYVFGANARDAYNLFPRSDFHESAFINLTNALLTLPDDSEYYSINEKRGSEEMCILLSKSPINTNSICKRVKEGISDVYTSVVAELAGRLHTGNPFSNTDPDKIDFDYKTDNDTVLALFIKVNH